MRAGGGYNHRMDLAAAVLVKDNHLAAVDGDVGVAVRRARDMAPPGSSVEVECDTPAQVEAALAAGADGVSGRMTVRSTVPGSNPNWMVFALSKQVFSTMIRS